MAQAHFEPTWAFIKRPAGYPTGPAVGKPALILQSKGNDHSLYHRLSPYSNYHQGLISWGDEPYYYIYPDQAKNFPQTLKQYDSHIFAPGSGIIDVIRTSKFLVSGRGVTFLATQFLLQTASPYNERRIYNPTSPIVAAGLTLTLGTARPDRAFDTSGGLAGIASTLLGGLGSAIFGAPKTNPVAGTTLVNNADALPTATSTTGTKGLLRAGDALRAKSHLEIAWSGGGGAKKGFSLKGLLTGLFQNFIPQTQDGIQYRSDEGAYGLMIGSGTGFFKSTDQRGGTTDFLQMFIGGGKVTRPNGEYPGTAARLFVNYDGTPKVIKVLSLDSQPSLPGIGEPVGYSVDESKKTDPSPGYKYGDAVGAKVDGEFKASDIMIQYGMYAQRGQNYPTKKTDKASVDTYNSELKKILATVPKVGNGNIYTINLPTNAKAITSPNRSADGYDQVYLTTKGQDRTRGVSPKDYPLGFLSDYRGTNITTVDETLNFGSNRTYKLPTNGTFDAINTLDVLDKPRSVTNFVLNNWTTWEPFKDDLVALYFYDVVNEKYIPFRASIKGISEAGNASWEEMPFIGRADKVYSYGGFNRNLSFTIKIVMSSIVELAPTWQRINYMMTSYKPANYTKAAGVVASGNSRYDRFMVPPMFMLTLGDMYRDQPILIQSVTLTVPDDAAWETLNEENQGNGDWYYLANKYIKAGGRDFGQVPREIELGFTVVLLEKERAVVGGANFGHAPRNESFEKWNTDTQPDGKAPNHWNKNYMVDVINAGYAP